MRTSNLLILFSLLLSSSAFAKENQAYCSQYAQTAVNQNQQNLKQKCDLDGLRWSNDYEGQKQWCMTVSETITANESQARQDALKQCNSQNSKTLKVKHVKYSGVQQLFPQKAVNTNLQNLAVKDLDSFFEKLHMPSFDFTLSASGQWLAQGGLTTNDSSLKIWDLNKGKLLYLLGEEKGGAYFRLTFSPDEKLLIAGDNETTDIWDWRNARLLFRLKDYYLPKNQVIDDKNKIYLISKNKRSVARFNLLNGELEKSWNLASQFKEIQALVVNQKGYIAYTVPAWEGVSLKVFDSQNNRAIYEKILPKFSAYNNKGNYLSGKILSFIGIGDNADNLVFYTLESENSKPYLSILDLTTGMIKKSIVEVDNSGIFLDDLGQLVGKVNLCPDVTRQIAWKDVTGIDCELNDQQIKSNHIVSTYTIRYKKQYLDKIHSLHDIKGNLLAFFGADSNSRWYWLNAQTDELKNSGALWTDRSDPKRKPNTYHFSSQQVPVKLNQKNAKQYSFPKADIHRLEVFMGADENIDHKPNIKPSYGNYELSHNGRWLVVGGQDGDTVASFDLWDLDNKEYVKSFQSKIAWTHSALAFSPDDRYLVIYYGSTRGHYAPCMECSSVIDIWDLKTSRYKFSIPGLERNNDTTKPVIFDNGDIYLNIGNKAIQRWNIKQERFVDRFRIAKQDEEIFSLVGNGGDLLAISVEKVLRNNDNSLKSATSWIEVWSRSQQKLIQKINVMDNLVGGGLAFNTAFVTDHKIAIATRLNDIVIWDSLSGDKLKVLVPAKKELGFTYHLSSEGDGILISSGKFVQRWNTATGKLLTTVNACQPEMPGLPIERYALLKEYHGFGSAKVAAGKVISSYSCPQGGRSKIWNMKTGALKVIYGKNANDEWFWLNDLEELKSTVSPPAKQLK